MTPSEIKKAANLLSSVNYNEECRAAIKDYVVCALSIGRTKDAMVPINLSRQGGNGTISRITINDCLSDAIMAALDDYYDTLIQIDKAELRDLGAKID